MVRARAVGRLLTVARRPVTPARRVAVVRPALPPVVTPPVRRPGSRPPLGAPLAELPPTAVPSAPGAPAAGSAPAPAMPVVQRQAEPGNGAPLHAERPEVPDRPGGPGGAKPRVRSGLGAPLPSLPPTASVPAATRPLTRADVRRALAPDHASPLREGSGVQRRTAEPSTAPASPPAPPLVQRPTTPQDTAAAPTAPHLAGHPGGPAGVRRADRPVPAVAVTAGSERSGTPPYRRTVQLLAARPLALGSSGDMGSAAAPARRTAASRPVVAARWPGSPTAPPVQRAAVGRPGPTSATPVPAPRPDPVVRPAPGPRPATAPGEAPATRLPVTTPQAPPLVVQPAPAGPLSQPVPVVRPGAAPPAARPADPPSVRREPARGPGNGTPAPAAAAGPPPPGSGGSNGGGDLDLDDLARRLLDPVTRLLRTELRRGRERAGRPFDGRR
ncbi:hypothetical protein AB0940_19245 [Streptomyces sp. NPDC006656]|uniref:hypothetical protein n=1 Tax=Streptomyces sp. NPDC006656 TaxID=3156899 RepID=UPI003452DF87